MSRRTAKSIMVPLADYAVVPEDTSILEAVQALEQAQLTYQQSTYKHRAILVVDASGHVIGKLSQNDVLLGLEPGFRRDAPLTNLSHWELCRPTLQSMIDDANLWRKPLEDICHHADTIKVKDIMYTPADGEYVNQETALYEAIHQLVVGHHQSLLVVDENKRVVGILRLADVFHEVVEIIKANNP